MELPDGWNGHPDDECATFCGTPSLGVLQISSARKDIEPVTDQDLMDFAQEHKAPNLSLVGVRYGAFTGFFAEHYEGGLSWREWWLKSNSLLVYVTYNASREKELLERDAIEGILASLSVIQ